MYFQNQCWVASCEGEKVCILPKMANRHGLIAGATGTGKTITLKVLAESFSACGVPVFLADAKGDLAGMCQPGEDNEGMQKRIAKFGLGDAGFHYHSYPTCFWDIFEQAGLPLRTTISEMGPTLLANLMELNQTQSDILNIIFRIADEQGLLLLDTKDLRAMLQYVGDNCADFTTQYGNITKQSVGAITRSLISLEDQGAKEFFGEPALDIRDWFTRDMDGRGTINILHCASLINQPKMYSTFMLWMLSELFEIMPEAGDLEKPKMVFFFDEAHLLFDNAPKALLQKIEQVVKLIRSKGVGIYFITQSPSDIPDEVLSQLGNRIQHALRAYTPSDQKAVKAAAQSFRVNPEFDTSQVITELGIGQALVSFLQEDGSPSIVKRCSILPPESRMGSIDDSVRQSQITGNLLYSRYGTALDRDSAYEFLQRKQQQDTEAEAKAQEEEKTAKENALKEKEEAKQKDLDEKAEAKQEAAEKKELERQLAQKEKEAERAAKELERERAKKTSSTRHRQTPLEKAANSAMSTIGREVGRNLIRGLMNNLKF